MAPGNTKSDFIGVQRIKTEGNKSVIRKGLTKNGANFKGVSISMASAGETQHNGACTTPTISSSSSSPVLKTPKQSEHSTKDLLGSGDRVGLPENMKVKPDHQVPHLKSLSMLHLDFIEQQQSQLQTQEKEIYKLRSENDTLKCRLERMKRRTLLAGKGNQLDGHTNHIDANQKKELLIKRKRSAVCDSPSTTRHETESRTVYPTSASKGGSKQPRIQQSRWVKKDNLHHPTTPQSSPHKFHYRGSKLAKDAVVADEDNEEREGGYPLEYPIDDECYEWTRMLYPCLSDLRVDMPDPELPGGPVLVPSWRHRSLSASSIENTGEELTDEAFDRRHGKLEVDERKRKRWDAQRIRELREHDRLESKARRKELGLWDDTLLSFHPDASEARKVQVEETVPVTAFGALIPISETGNFDVPWFDANERESAESKRQTRSRACKN